MGQNSKILKAHSRRQEKNLKENQNKSNNLAGKSNNVLVVIAQVKKWLIQKSQTSRIHLKIKVFEKAIKY